MSIKYGKNAKMVTGIRNPTLVTLGRTVRTFREAGGMIQAQLAGKVGYTDAWLSNVETGQLRPRPEQLTALEEALGVPAGVLKNIYRQLDAESLPGYFRTGTEEERRASVLRTFQIALIPDLLQTEEYARTLHPDDEDEAALRSALDRQAVLARPDAAPPRLHCVLDEAVLLRGRGGAAVMRDQLLHLIAKVSPPRLTIQVLYSADNPYPYGAFTIATVDDGEAGHIPTAVRDIVTGNHDDLAGLNAAWDAVRTFALSQRESIELIQRMADDDQA
jgi:transcriptional regulator with XRE-family HTH domain